MNFWKWNRKQLCRLVFNGQPISIGSSTASEDEDGSGSVTIDCTKDYLIDPRLLELTKDIRSEADEATSSVAIPPQDTYRSDGNGASPTGSNAPIRGSPR